VMLRRTMALDAQTVYDFSHIHIYSMWADGHDAGRSGAGSQSALGLYPDTSTARGASGRVRRGHFTVKNRYQDTNSTFQRAKRPRTRHVSRTTSRRGNWHLFLRQLNRRTVPVVHPGASLPTNTYLFRGMHQPQPHSSGPRPASAQQLQTPNGQRATLPSSPTAIGLYNENERDIAAGSRDGTFARFQNPDELEIDDDDVERARLLPPRRKEGLVAGRKVVNDTYWAQIRGQFCSAVFSINVRMSILGANRELGYLVRILPNYKTKIVCMAGWLWLG
jgi:hypothetical protein